MARDHTKLRFFALADELPVRVYRVTELLPSAERFGLRSQLRRASVSVAVNVVEGACRQSDAAYRHFLEIALGSASETRYLLQLCLRLRLLGSEAVQPLIDDYSIVIRSLQALISRIEAS
jgi:four helix bundle protein